MSSRMATLAQSLLDYIEGGTPYSISNIRFSRRWLPFFDRSEVGDRTHVLVVPNETQMDVATRGRMRTVNVSIDTYVQASASHDKTATIDLLSDVAEEILDRANSHVPSAIDSISFGLTVVTFEPYMVGEHLLEQRLFTSRITSTYLAVY